MTKNLQVYKCEICGNIVEILHEGVGQLVCCNQPMKLMEENVVDAAVEKHVPVVEETADSVKVSVGSVAHPMEEKHHIEWVERVSDGRTCRRSLKPGDSPEAEFVGRPGRIRVRAYCNLHGLWKSKEA
jgi:superoxide reductase